MGGHQVFSERRRSRCCSCVLMRHVWNILVEKLKLLCAVFAKV